MAELQDLEPLIGTWDMEAVFSAEREVPSVAGEVMTTFEWTLGGKYLLQRAVAPSPIPNAMCLIGVDADGGGFTQHYFDDRGVARVYAMTFDGTTWTLERSGPDFSPFEFSQRYVGTVADDGNSISGAWEICHDGTTWQPDFQLSYRRRA